HRHCLLCTPLVRADGAAETLAALIEWLRSGEGASVVSLQYIPGDGPFHRALQPGEDLERWIDEFLKLEASGWKGKEGSAMICSEANRRFLTETFRAA